MPKMPKPSRKDSRSLKITFLTPVSLGSLNGSDKEADNVSSIKKLTRGSKAYPYVSSQALRRALRDQIEVLGEKLSQGVAAKDIEGAKGKNPSITKCLPEQYIDDDLFGFMDASKGGAHKRTSPVRVAPLLAIDPFEGDLDFGTNYMGVDSGGNPNVYETEIHGGLYRGTILVELDAVGKGRVGEGASAARPRDPWELPAGEKARRVEALLAALQHLWSTGRQSRYLADISPKFVAAALTTAKVPLFLESVRRLGPREDDALDVKAPEEAVADAGAILAEHCYGARAGLFAAVPEGTTTVGAAFDTIRGWVRDHYGA